jgi:hypothetical protein
LFHEEGQATVMGSGSARRRRIAGFAEFQVSHGLFFDFLKTRPSFQLKERISLEGSNRRGRNELNSTKVSFQSLQAMGRKK